MDHYLSAAIRGEIEERYYALVNEQSRLETLRKDAQFLYQEDDHVGLYSDHGVVHVRDVAKQVVSALDVANGILIPARTAAQLAWLQGYGVLVAYLHDIGMRDFSPFGRKMHPEFAAQAVYSAELDDVVDAIWRENSGNVPWRILQLASGGSFRVAPETVLRELLALSLAHSKSKIPTSVLNNPQLLRQAAVKVVRSDLQHLYQKQQVQRARQQLNRAGAKAKAALEATLHSAEQRLAEANKGAVQENPEMQRFYGDIEREAFAWLTDDAAALVALTQDVVDTLRALRCADGLRQRGTVLKTSGGYEVFVNHSTANAVYALREGDEKLFLLETESTFSAGEANVASSELDREGNLRISFGRGSFTSEAASAHAVRCAAAVVADIALDVLSSFDRWADEHPLQTAQTRLLLEETDDDLLFAERVREAVEEMAPSLEQRIDVVPSLGLAPQLEQERYLAAEALDWDYLHDKLFWRNSASMAILSWTRTRGWPSSTRGWRASRPARRWSRRENRRCLSTCRWKGGWKSCRSAATAPSQCRPGCP